MVETFQRHPAKGRIMDLGSAVNIGDKVQSLTSVRPLSISHGRNALNGALTANWEGLKSLTPASTTETNPSNPFITSALVIALGLRMT